MFWHIRLLFDDHVPEDHSDLSDSSVYGDFPKALSQVSILEISYPMAAFRSAILSRLLPCGILFESTLPPLILLLGASLSREEKCCACRELAQPFRSNFAHQCEYS